MVSIDLLALSHFHMSHNFSIYDTFAGEPVNVTISLQINQFLRISESEEVSNRFIHI